MSYKKEYLVGETRIKILLIPNDNYSCLDFFVNDLLTVSVSYFNLKKLLDDVEHLEKMFLEYYKKENETSESVMDKINLLGYFKTK